MKSNLALLSKNGDLDAKAMLLKFIEENGDNLEYVGLVAKLKHGEYVQYASTTQDWFLATVGLLFNDLSMRILGESVD